MAVGIGAEQHAADRARQERQAERTEGQQQRGGRIAGGEERLGEIDREIGVDRDVEPFERIAERGRDDELDDVLFLRSCLRHSLRRRRYRHLISPVARRFAQIPEQARHDAERLFGHRQQNVFVGRMLGAAGIGMRHPDRRQTQRLGEHIVRQRAAEIRQHRRRLSGGLPDRVRRPVDPGTVEIGSRGDEALRRADLDHRKAVGVQMRAHGVDDLFDLGADHEAKLQDGARMAGNRIGGLVDIARRHRQHFERVPGVEPFGRRQPVLAPILRQRRLFRHRLDLDVGKQARIWLDSRGGFSASSFMRPWPSTSDAMALARMVAGLASTPPQLPE